MTITAWLTVGCVVLVALCAVLLVMTARARRAHDREATGPTEAEQERIAELAVATERTRIVREMHDVIAHSLAIMIAQADGGRFVADDPDAARRAFTTIADTGRGALADTRRILGMLRNPDADSDLSPAPDHTDIDALVTRAEESGLSIALVRLGEPVTLPSASSLALFRICQEAITNVIKHAGGTTRCVVTQSWRADEVVLTVTNEATAATARVAVGGQGLIGMRERAEMVGGELTCGPLDDRFQVRAVIPYTTRESWDE
ncbi:MAG: histidine kinase [Micrococcales bacterium]|nr:histidine kinase [Micrococcales bacterium]